MKAKELSKILNRMRYTIVHTDKMLNRSPAWRHIEKYKIKGEYTPEKYLKDLEAINKFREGGYDLYDRKFLQMGLDSSICAAAKPLSDSLEYVMDNCIGEKLSEYKYLINYRDCKNDYLPSKRYFKTSAEAWAWMVETFDTPNKDSLEYIGDYSEIK